MTQLLEYEGKALLAAEGVTVPRGMLAANPAEAQAAASELGGRVAVKTQIPTGGRGKAGGVVIVDAPEAGAAAAQLLGREIKGWLVETLLIEEALEANAEIYLGIAIDPRQRAPVLLVGANGGVDVESSAEEVASVPWDLARGLRPAHVWEAADRAGLETGAVAALVPVAQAAARVFLAKRAQLVELNPLLQHEDLGLVAVDVRIVPDDAVYNSRAAGDEIHAESRRLGFDYVTLDENGEVGLITTGAGASMLLIDLLADAGLSAIDFCDLRTGTLRGDGGRLRFVLDQLAVSSGLRVLLVNVFAGVTELGEFVGLFLDELEVRRPAAPIVVRVEGRDAVDARGRLAEAGLRCVTTLDELVEAAADIVAGERAAT